MLQQGQHRAVRGLLVEAQTMVLSATRYDGDPSPPMLDRRTDTAINPGNSGGPLVDSNCKACLSRNKLIYNETYLFWEENICGKVEKLQLHVNCQRGGWISWTPGGGRQHSNHLWDCGSFHNDFLCDAIFYWLLPSLTTFETHMFISRTQGLAFAVPSNTLSFAAWLLFATQEFYTLDVTLRQQFVCEVVSQLMQFPGCNKVGLRIWLGVFSGPIAEQQFFTTTQVWTSEERLLWNCRLGERYMHILYRLYVISYYAWRL